MTSQEDSSPFGCAQPFSLLATTELLLVCPPPTGIPHSFPSTRLLSTASMDQ